MAGSSERRKQRRHYLKMMKKQIGTNIDGDVFTNESFNDMKKGFRIQGKQLRLDDLRASLEIEKDSLIEKETELRDKLKSEGLSKKKIDKAIESWYDSQKIWSLHSDVYDELS
jgi:hypothetical protein